MLSEVAKLAASQASQRKGKNNMCYARSLYEERNHRCLRDQPLGGSVRLDDELGRKSEQPDF